MSEYHGRIYSGDLYCRKYGTNDAFISLGNVTKFTTKSSVEKKELKGTGRDNYGQAIDTIVTPKPVEVKIEFNTFDKHGLARALMGEAVDNAGQVITIEETTISARKNGFIKLAHDDIDPANFELKKVKGKTLIDKEKYELNHRLGMVRFIDSADITEGEDLTYTGKTKGRAHFSIESGTLTDIVLELYLDGQDRISKKDGILTVPHVVLSADGDIDWFDDKWWQAGLSGTIVKDDKKAAMSFKEFA